MQQNSLLVVIASLFAGFLSTVCLSWVVRAIGRKLDLRDAPDGVRKLQAVAIPNLGGIAIFLGAALGLSFAIQSDSNICSAFSSQRDILVLLSCAAIYCLIGVVDDRVALTPGAKLSCQVLAAAPLAVFSQPPGLIHVCGWAVELGSFGGVFVILWMVLCANVINLMDGMDGVAGVVSIVALATICVVAYGVSSLIIVCMATTLIGCVSGFLVFNRPPASLYMGDGGSLLLGSLIGGLSLIVSAKMYTGLALAVPVGIVSIPLMDTAVAILRRRLAGRSIGSGDREHLHHQLKNSGLTITQVLVYIAAICSVSALAAVVSAWTLTDWPVFLVGGLTFVFMVYTNRFGRNEVRAIFKQAQAILGGGAKYQRPGLVGPRLAAGTSKHDELLCAIWQEICEDMGSMVQGLELRVRERDEEVHHRTFRRPPNVNPSTQDKREKKCGCVIRICLTEQSNKRQTDLVLHGFAETADLRAASRLGYGELGRLFAMAIEFANESAGCSSRGAASRKSSLGQAAGSGVPEVPKPIRAA